MIFVNVFGIEAGVEGEFRYECAFRFACFIEQSGYAQIARSRFYFNEKPI